MSLLLLLRSSTSLSSVTFDPATSSTDWSLSPDKLTATRTTTATGFWAMAFSTTSQLGPASAFWTVDALDTGAWPMQIGAAVPGDSTPGINGQGLGTYYRSDGAICSWSGPMNGATAPTYGVGDKVGFTLDGLGNITFYKNGTAVATGALGASASGRLLAALSNGNGTGTSATADFSRWGAAVTRRPRGFAFFLG